LWWKSPKRISSVQQHPKQLSAAKKNEEEGGEGQKKERHDDDDDGRYGPLREKEKLQDEIKELRQQLVDQKLEYATSLEQQRRNFLKLYSVGNYEEIDPETMQHINVINYPAVGRGGGGAAAAAAASSCRFRIFNPINGTKELYRKG